MSWNLIENFTKIKNLEKEKDLKINPLNKMIKVPPKVRKLNALTMVVKESLLLIVLTPNISKSLCRLHGVTLILKKVVS